MAVSKAEYERLKKEYHVKGRRAAGRGKASKEWKAYDAAKQAYHRAGEELLKQREKGD